MTDLLRHACKAAIAVACGALFATSAPAWAEDIDAEALAAVTEHGERLRTLGTFSIDADLVFEEVMETGEKITVIEQVTADVRAPNSIRMTKSMPDRKRVLFFDGQKVVLWSPILKFYAEMPFEGTTAEMIGAAAERAGYELPLSDLFIWGVDPADVEAVTQAAYIGQAMIDGRLCDQYALRQEDADWQIWIDTAEPKLACRYAIVDLSDEARPIFQATVRIDTDVDLADSRFTFEAPEGAERIQFSPPSAE